MQATVVTSVSSNSSVAPASKPSVFTSEVLMSGPVELQTGIGEWKNAFLELFENGLRVTISDESPTDICFAPETRISIPMRNLKSSAHTKGCAFQVENGSETRTFLAPTLADKNNWARKLNIALGELRTSLRYITVLKDEDDDDEFAVGDENCGPRTPAHVVTKAAVQDSAERQRTQKMGVQRLAMSLQPQRTAARAPMLQALDTNFDASAPKASPAPMAAMPPLSFGGPARAVAFTDRSAEIEALQRCVEAREQELKTKERELKDAQEKLDKEQRYREQISSGVEKWKADMTRQKDQKIKDTVERLEDELKRADKMEKERDTAKEELAEAQNKIATLEETVQRLESEVEDAHGLKAEIAALRQRLEKELAFVQVLEHDTQQMADELLNIGRQHFELKERYEGDMESYRGQCLELKQQLASKEEENLQLKEELGRIQLENRRLLEAQHRMHREFFFSLALSIKLSLAQQGIYSNADLNQLYEKILAVDYGQWHKFIETQLRQSEMDVPTQTQQQQQQEPQTPMDKNKQRAPVDNKSAAKKKPGLFGGFFG